MKAILGKDLARVLKKKGWEPKRVTGSHHIFVKPGNPARISVPVHGNKPLKVGLLRHLMRLADIEESEL